MYERIECLKEHLRELRSELIYLEREYYQGPNKYPPINNDFYDFINNVCRNRMILITGIKYEFAPGDEADVYNALDNAPRNLSYTGPISPVEMWHERVKGKRYVNEDGVEVCLGVTRHVQDLLSLPFSEFENLQNSLNDLKGQWDRINKEYIKQQKIIDSFKNKTFWQRLVFLFKRKL